jgi:hypothetical protein
MLGIFMLGVIMLSHVMLLFVILSDVMLSVVRLNVAIKVIMLGCSYACYGTTTLSITTLSI